MRRLIRNHLLPCSILALLMPLFTLVTSAAYYVIGMVKYHMLYLPRGGVAAILTLLCYLVLNLLYLAWDSFCCYESIRKIRTQKSTKTVLCLILSLIGLITCIILWIFTFGY